MKTTRRGLFGLLAAPLVACVLPKPTAKPLPPGKNISIRVIRTYDPIREVFINRMDCLYRVTPLRAEYACKVVGGE